MIGMLLNILFGCHHKRFTRPITPVHRAGRRHENAYVACLDCGKQFHYDVLNWRMGGPV